MSRFSQMRASVYDVPVAERDPIADLIGGVLPSPATAAEPSPTPLSEPEQKGRGRIWDLHKSFHCSIIGTCLTQGELHRLLRRLKVAGVETADDHDLHMLGVLLAGRPKEGAKLLQKTLDKRHQRTISQFSKAKDVAELTALWEAAMTGGDIPGAYWAVLTHPLCSGPLARRVFGDVHMLSHLMGATNRADIARLRELEQQNSALVERMDRQQKEMRAGMAERDQTIRRLNDLLAQKTTDDTQLQARANRADNFLEVIRALESRLDEEIVRRQSLEQELAIAATACEQAAHACQDAEGERDVLRREIALVEAQMDAVLQPAESSGLLDLSGVTVLYVGGRAKQVPQLRALVERLKGQFRHHDGGIEHSMALLPGHLSGADVAAFPVDCVSHEAVIAVKRVCDQLGKPYVPLRTSSLSCLLSALAAMSPQMSSSGHTLQ